MKKIFAYSCLFLTILVSGCSKDDNVKDNNSDNNGQLDSVYTYLSLKDYASNSFPDGDYWGVIDSEPSLSSFYNLRDALYVAKDQNREIYVNMAYLTSMPSASSQDAGALSYCSSLVSVEMPEVLTVGNYAFAYSESMICATMPKVTSIGSSAFAYCESLESIELPEATTIEESAFRYCGNLTSIDMPEATYIGASAFRYCVSLTQVSIATNDSISLEYIDPTAFENAKTENITLTVGVESNMYISGKTFNFGSFSQTFKEIIVVDGSGNKVSSYSLDDFSAKKYPDLDIWIIDDIQASTSDFSGLSAAIAAVYEADPSREISLYFPYLEAIPDYAIFGKSATSASYVSTALVSVSAGQAQSVGSNAFYACGSLRTINISEATTIGNNAFDSCYSLEDISLPNVLTVGEYAFSSCDKLVSASLPLATTIASSGFYFCSALTTLDLSSVETIEKSAFRYCDSMVEITMPRVSSIGEYAFRYCSSLKYVGLATDEDAWIQSLEATARNHIDIGYRHHTLVWCHWSHPSGIILPAECQGRGRCADNKR